MRFKTEEVSTGQPILIINRHDTQLNELLKDALKPFNTEVFLSPYVSDNLEKFDYIFIVDDVHSLYKAINYQYKQIIFISRKSLKYIDNIKGTIKIKQLSNIKLIQLPPRAPTTEELDKILWFGLDKGSEVFLNLDNPLHHIKRTQKKQTSYNVFHYLSLKEIFKGAFLVLILSHFFFFPFLFLSWFYGYRTAVLLKTNHLHEVDASIEKSKRYFNSAQHLYSIPRQTLLIFSTSLFADNLIDVTDDSLHALEAVISLRKNGQQLATLLLKTDKSASEKNDITLRLQKIKRDIGYLQDTIPTLKQRIPEYHPRLKNLKSELNTATELLTKSQKLLEHIDILFARNTEKKYLLLFANNMELRPGGGFIGSYGILKIQDYTIKEIKVYDVYDADGQLHAHIEPPEPLKKYLNAEHWFLRDSAFSPDFIENYAQAKFFLDREINERNFDGAIMLTTTAVQHMLEAFGDVYLPDFKEKVNAKNFYIKTQFYAEKDFFPGSTQKKGFLASLTRNILINLETASFPRLALALKNSFDEKQIVAFFNDAGIQNTIDSLYWSGRLIQPKCTTASIECFVDYLFPIDANVGGNKANFFVNRVMHLYLSIDKDGHLKHTFTIEFKNNSFADVYPGGQYHNYFQLLLPKDITLKQVTQNGVEIDNVETSVFSDNFQKIGFSTIISPQKVTTIEFQYTSNKAFKRGNNIYQLIIQKQIGSSNNDLNIEVSLPDNIHLASQNFSPLVKDGRILYNTNLTADKIFFIELLKE